MPLTNNSTAKQEEKQEVCGRLETLATTRTSKKKSLKNNEFKFKTF